MIETPVRMIFRHIGFSIDQNRTHPSSDTVTHRLLTLHNLTLVTSASCPIKTILRDIFSPLLDIVLTYTHLSLDAYANSLRSYATSAEVIGPSAAISALWVSKGLWNAEQYFPLVRLYMYMCLSVEVEIRYGNSGPVPTLCENGIRPVTASSCFWKLTRRVRPVVRDLFFFVSPTGSPKSAAVSST